MDGMSRFDGRPEISLDGQWGGFSDDKFRENEAVVFCKMMNKRYVHTHLYSPRMSHSNTRKKDNNYENNIFWC